MYIYVYLHTYIRVYAYTCVHVCACKCVYVHIYIYIYMYAYLFSTRSVGMYKRKQSRKSTGNFLASRSSKPKTEKSNGFVSWRAGGQQPLCTKQLPVLGAAYAVPQTAR